MSDRNTTSMAGKAHEGTLLNQIHGCIDGFWEDDEDELRAKLVGGDCGDSGFCHGLCPPSMVAAPDADQRFIPEVGRYVLYVSAGCPFAARPWMVSCALGLSQSGILRISRVFPGNSSKGWFVNPVSDEEKQFVASFPGENTHDADDPVFKANGWTHLREMYLASNPKYTGVVSVPVLFDTKTNRIVSNQSFDCALMLAECLSPLVPAEHRSEDLTAETLFGKMHSDRRSLVHSTGKQLHAEVNLRPYKVHGAKTQQEYQEQLDLWYKKLDELNSLLQSQPWVLEGDKPSFCDLQLYASLVRFELVYRPYFRMQEYRLEDFPTLLQFIQKVYKLPGISHCLEPQNITRNYYFSFGLRARAGITAPRPPKWLQVALGADADSKNDAGRTAAACDP